MAKTAADAKTKLTLAIKRRFSELTGELSPENLCCDGELRGSALTRKANKLRAEWLSLENKVGRKVSEDEVYTWNDELRKDAEKRVQKEMAKTPSHPLLKQSNPHVWAREGGVTCFDADQRWTAYYIQNFHNKVVNFGGKKIKITAEDKYNLFSEFARMLGMNEKLGSFDTLDEAVAAGEAFLKTVTFAEFKKRTEYLDENIVRDLKRLPEELQAAAMEGA